MNEASPIVVASANDNADPVRRDKRPHKSNGQFAAVPPLPAIECPNCHRHFVPARQKQQSCSYHCASVLRAATRRAAGQHSDQISDQLIRDGVALVNEGLSWPQAAKRIGVCASTLRKRAAREEMPRRRGARTFHFAARLTLPERDVDLAYLAALLDGEGHVSIKRGHWVRIGITNTDVPIMEWLASMGGSVRQQSPTEISRKACFLWQLTSRADNRQFLQAIVPYMRIKRARALEALQELDALLTTAVA